MLNIAFLIGVYSYTVLFLGLVGLLNFSAVFLVTSIFIIVGTHIVHARLRNLKLKSLSVAGKLLAGLILLLATINLFGALGPELAFDATWYHLTIPKLFIQNQSIYFIPGNLFYYSLMPKLTEMLYVAGLILGNEITTKTIHFSFGILCLIAVYKISRLYLNQVWSLLAGIFFYSNLVVSWLSITSYVDLCRSFFELLSLYLFLKFVKDSNVRHLFASAVILGLAIATKTLALSMVPFLMVVVFFIAKKNSQKIAYPILLFITSITVCLPWFVIAFMHTGNPFYPVLTNYPLAEFSAKLLNPFTIFNTFKNLLLFAPDPINPLYLVFLPSLLFFRNYLKEQPYKVMVGYVIWSFAFWYFFAQSGVARFLISSLGVFAVLITGSVFSIKDKHLKALFISLVILVSLVTLIYRSVANYKYIPFLTRQQSKEEFLMQNLNFAYGDFYDQNSDIKKLVGENTVMLIGLHNLYYVDFNYTLPEWNSKAEYILVQNADISALYKNLKFLYKNNTTHVTLYKL